MSEYEKIRVGRYLVIGSGKEWNVMEQFGSYRMFKRTFKTPTAAEKFAQEVDAQ